MTIENADFTVYGASLITSEELYEIAENLIAAISGVEVPVEVAA